MNKKTPVILNGGRHTDHRGTIGFVNEFDMSQVKRFYTIDHPSTQVNRGWRAHKIEQRWFYLIAGEFLVRIVKIDHWKSPNKYLPIEEFILSSENNEVLHIPNGFGSCLKATRENSKLIVFADFGIENASKDNYLYPEDYFMINKK